MRTTRKYPKGNPGSFYVESGDKGDSLQNICRSLVAQSTWNSSEYCRKMRDQHVIIEYKLVEVGRFTVGDLRAAVNNGGVFVNPVEMPR